jgi:hypothetical protein
VTWVRVLVYLYRRSQGLTLFSLPSTTLVFSCACVVARVAQLVELITSSSCLLCSSVSSIAFLG